MTANGAPDLWERMTASNMIYEGRILNLRVDSVTLPNGQKHSREVIEHEPAVVIVAENDKGEILLIDQFRYAVNRTMTELPAGIVEKGENPDDAANRELSEETGWRGGEMERIHSFYSSPGFTNETMYMYHATSLTPAKLPHDEDEFIVPRFATRDEVRRLIMSGDMFDGKTLLGLYWWLGHSSRKDETR